MPLTPPARKRSGPSDAEVPLEPIPTVSRDAGRSADAPLPARRPPVVMAVLVVLAAFFGLTRVDVGEGPAPAEPAPTLATEPAAAPDPPAPPATLFVSPPSPAVTALQGLVASINQGDTEQALQLMLAELPEVPGLGTAEYPYFAGDVGLWQDGLLDRERAAEFVSYFAELPGAVALADCEGFSDGPKVTIAMCSYVAAQGESATSGASLETGRLVGLVVDDKVAGMVRRADLVPKPSADRMVLPPTTTNRQ
jgi:hypothetical protein